MFRNKEILACVLIVISAFFVSTGQLFWKVSLAQINIWLLLGFVAYGFGGMLMIIALKYGRLSVIHPLMAIGYVFATFYSFYFLEETFSNMQIIGAMLILIGVVMLGRMSNE